MAITIQRLGPGTLTLGAGALAVQAQLTGCKLVPTESVETDPAVKVLSGEETPAIDTPTYACTLQGTYLQELLAAGVMAWSWANKGTDQAFTFKPNGSAATFVGTLQPAPLQVGGDDVGGRLEGSFTWRCVGMPVPTWIP
jgi:hypothetical protein